MTPDDAKFAVPGAPILAIIRQRWSPYRYQPISVEQDKLNDCLTAASWAASSYNEQPWIFFVARRDQGQEFEKMLGCLMEANQQWAKHAGALILTAYRKNFSQNGKPNRVALHDLGQAAAYLALQAAAVGLQAHQMAGVNLSLVRQMYQVPDEFEPATAIAVGYADQNTSDSQDVLAERDLAPRNRLPLSEFVYFGSYAKR